LASLKRADEIGTNAEGINSGGLPDEEEFIKLMEELMKEVEVENASGGNVNETGGNAQPPQADMINDMFQNMIHKFLDKEMFYPPMKDMRDKFKVWLDTHKNLSENPAELRRYTKQYECIQKICTIYETNSPDVKEVLELMNEIQQYGGPPKEILAEMAPGFDLDKNGCFKGLPFLGGDKGGDGKDCVLM